MSKHALAVAGILAAVLLAILSSSLFTVSQAEQALVVRMGAPRAVITTPGLKVKWPLIEDVLRYDARILDLDSASEQILLGDRKRILVDSFARYRIVDPLAFYRSVRTEEMARQRLREIVGSSMRRVLGNVMLSSVLSDERTKIMAEIQAQVTDEAKALGIAIADVRIRRADLPEETSQSIYERMKSEREREAREARAQGQERSQQIRSRAERERTVILAEAQRQAQIARGEGEAEANGIFAQAYNRDPEFYALYRSLQAYRDAFTDSTTSMVLSPNSEFMRFFRNPAGSGGAEGK
jgi:membrane protease subunit HflC